VYKHVHIGQRRGNGLALSLFRIPVIRSGTCRTRSFVS
jgi:hypothetical protein